MRGLEESGIQPVNDSQLSKQSIEALIELEQEIKSELNGKKDCNQMKRNNKWKQNTHCTNIHLLTWLRQHQNRLSS